MPFPGSSVRSILRMSVLLAVCVLGALQTSSAIPSTTVTYQFVGQCSDCTGTGTASLTLQNYTLGTSLSNSNFVSFTYTSNLTTFSLTAANSPTLLGMLPASLPATAQVTVSGYATNPNYFFGSQTDGSWCVGFTCLSDTGTSSSWSLNSPNVPTLRYPTLAGLAALLAAAGVLLLRQARRRVSV